MMRWLIPIGLGAAVAGLVIAARKKKDEAPRLSRTPTYNPNNVRTRSPGQPQPTSYNVNLGELKV